MAGDPSSLLKPGSIQIIYDGMKDHPLYSNPWVQVLSVKKIPVAADASGTAAASERYRIIVSDGKHCVPGMLMTQLKGLVESGAISNYCILKLQTFLVNVVKGKKILVVRTIEPTEIIQFDRKVGEPVPLDSVSEGNAEKTAPSMPPFTVSPAPITRAIHQQAIPDHSMPDAVPMMSTNYQQQHTMPAKTASSNDPFVQPISSLSPYNNKWTIKARVTSKSEIRQFSNARGEGKLFSVNLLDESGEIKSTAFGEAVDMFYPLLEVNKVYLISKCPIKIAKRQFSTVQNEYEMSFDKNSSIQPCFEGIASIPTIKYNFVPISSISSVEMDGIIDVIGIVKECGDVQNLIAKTTQKPLTKRDLTLVDMTQNCIKLTLWGQSAEQANYFDYPVIAIKGVKVSDYGGRSLSTMTSSLINLNPDIRESHELRGWYDTMGAALPTMSVSSAINNQNSMQANEERKLISAVKEENLGRSDKPDFYSMLASVIFVKGENMYYTACPSDGCNKKVISEGSNSWRCEKCQKSFDRCDYRYIMSVHVGDFTGQMWVNLFNESGEMLLGGRKAEEMESIRQSNEDEFQQILRDSCFKSFIFKMKAKQEMYNGESKIRYTAMSISPVDYVKESRNLIETIQKY